MQLFSAATIAQAKQKIKQQANLMLRTPVAVFDKKVDTSP